MVHTKVATEREAFINKLSQRRDDDFGPRRQREKPRIFLAKARMSGSVKVGVRFPTQKTIEDYLTEEVRLPPFSDGTVKPVRTVKLPWAS